MDSIIFTENGQDMENESSQVITDCLGTPVILREILHHFSTSELVQLSLVNKLWSYEARSLLRDRGCLTGNLKCRVVTRARLSAFASDLRQMNVIPLSGITLEVGLRGDGEHNCEKSSTDFEPVYQTILDSLPWRHFSLTFYDCWDKCCPEFVLAKKVLDKFSSTLEQLSIGYGYVRAGFLQEFLQDFSFPRLKHLKFESKQGAFRAHDDDTKLIRAIVSRAPNLQVLNTEAEVNLQGNLMEGSSAVHVTDCPYSPYHDVPESVVGELRMKEFRLLSFPMDFSLERFNRVLPMLLQSSRTTLSSVYVKDVFLAPFALYRICLENVKKLTIIFQLTPDLKSEAAPGVWNIAKSFDFARVFPNLNRIDIRWSIPDGHDEIPEEFCQVLNQGNAALVEPMPDRASNIKHIRLESLTCAYDGVAFRRFLAETFPDVQRLSVNATGSGGIWDSWLRLKQLDVRLCGHWFKDAENLDTVFCGIFSEEADELLERDEEYLRSVNIVPLRPSIACLKGLKTLRFVVDDTYYHHCKNRRSLGLPLLFSKVTGLTVFKRYPDLQVTLETNCEVLTRALSHLKPFAAVILHKQLFEMADVD